MISNETYLRRLVITYIVNHADLVSGDPIKRDAGGEVEMEPCTPLDKRLILVVFQRIKVFHHVMKRVLAVGVLSADVMARTPNRVIDK